MGFICFKITKKFMVLRRVVVTGLGALTPIGNNIEEYWNSLWREWCSPITYFDASKFKLNFACELKNFNAEDFLDRKEARKWIAMHNMPWYRLKSQ
jgi:3-oxoacyl-[acyl-carrier-protein] synthase II